MKNKLFHLVLITCGLLTGAFAAFGQEAAPTGATGAPNAPNLKYGLYIHYGIATFARPGEQGQIPAGRFAPTALDAKAWAHAAKAAGMTFAVLTAKHESGFCLWDSPGYDYDVAQSPFKGDIIGDFIAACNAEGILPGVHYSIPDALNEGVARGRGPVSATYFALIKKHLTELHTRYPGIRIQVLDLIQRLSPDQLGEIRDLIKRLNPGCVLSGGDGGPRFDADTIFNGWMWKPQARLYPVQTLFDHYSLAQQTRRPYLLNVGPDPSGRIPDDQIAMLTQLKEMIATRPLTPPPAGTPAKPSAADRLKQLKSLYDQGLINKEDYDRKTKEIIDSL